MIRYVKSFDNKLLKKCTEIWERVSNLIKIKFDSEPVYGDNDKHIKTKIKIYEDKINTNLQSKKVPKENASQKNKMENLINDDLEQSASDDSDNESENESENETENDESNE